MCDINSAKPRCETIKPFICLVAILFTNKINLNTMKIIFTILLFSITICAFAQNNQKKKPVVKAKTVQKDTTIESDTTKENKEPQYFYLSVNANAFVNTKGGFAKRFSPSVEFGRTYGIFDLGIATGRINTFKKGGDTTHYIELRPTINIFSKGRFAESLCLGAGYVLTAKQGLMTEICNGINFNITETFAIAMLQGYIFLDGTNSNRSTQYVGLNFTYNFLKGHSVNKRRKRAALLNDN